MESVWKEDADYTGTNGVAVRTVNSRLNALERRAYEDEMVRETGEKAKPFKWGFRWKSKFKKERKTKTDLVLVIFFNKKNEIEVPTFVPVFSGNLVVYKDKAYEFDPRALWRIKGFKGNPICYCIKEIDRKPIKNPDGTYKMYKGMPVYKQDAAISNLDVDEIRARGDSTESDEFLIKAALKAQQSKVAAKGNWIIAVVLIAVLVGGVIWLIMSGGK